MEVSTYTRRPYTHKYRYKITSTHFNTERIKTRVEAKTRYANIQRRVVCSLVSFPRYSDA